MGVACWGRFWPSHRSAYLLIDYQAMVPEQDPLLYSTVWNYLSHNSHYDILSGYSLIRRRNFRLYRLRVHDGDQTYAQRLPRPRQLTPEY